MRRNNGHYIKELEEELAEFVGAKYGVAVDSGTNALFLLMKHLYKEPVNVELPSQTYMSVPMAIINSGHSVSFTDHEWRGLYLLKNTNIIDACNLFEPDMYCNNIKGNQYMFISFQQKKVCGVEKGGMIFTNSEDDAKILRRRAFDGRDYMLGANEDTNIIVGHHMNMTPDTAVKISLKYNTLSEKDFGSFGGSWVYRNLSEMECFNE